jgi:hypothetical protein
MLLLVRGMCVNTWGGFEVKQGRQGPFLRDVCRSRKSDPALFSPWDNLDRVQNHGEDTVAFSQLRFESCRTFCLLMNGGGQRVIK